MRRGWTVLLVAVLAVGCGDARPPHVLRLASAEPLGPEHAPALAAFARRVAAVSGGRLGVRVDDRGSSRDGEVGVIRDVAAGRAALGWAHATAFERVGVRQLDPLAAPMLVDTTALQDAVIRGAPGRRMLAGTAAAGVRGLALVPGPMSRLLAVGLPVRRLEDVRGRIVLVRDSAVAEQALRALAAYPRRGTPAGVAVAFADATQRGLPAAVVDDADSLFFDRVPCAGSPGCDDAPTWLAANVALWPRTGVLFASPRALAGLSARERAWVERAAAETADRAGAVSKDDGTAPAELCATGTAIAPLAGAELERLRQAWRPVLRRLERARETASTVREIVRLRDDLARSSPGDAGSCAAARAGPPIPDGVYRVQLTHADLRAAGARQAADRAGTVTMTLRRGRWTLVFTEPGRVERRGTYTGSLLRTAWLADTGDAAYVSVAVAPDGALRFHVGQATSPTSAQALLASHAWRRIGG